MTDEELATQRSEPAWDRPALQMHLSLHGFIALHSATESTVAVGGAADFERTVMLYRPHYRAHPKIQQRNTNWREIDWSELTDQELRKAYSLLVRARMIP